jgi:hypothetical protein
MTHSRRHRAELAGRLLDDLARHRRHSIHTVEAHRALVRPTSATTGAVPPAHTGGAAPSLARFIVATCEYPCRECGRVQIIESRMAPTALRCCSDEWVYGRPGALEGEGGETAA